MTCEVQRTSASGFRHISECTPDLRGAVKTAFCTDSHAEEIRLKKGFDLLIAGEIRLSGRARY